MRISIIPSFIFLLLTTLSAESNLIVNEKIVSKNDVSAFLKHVSTTNIYRTGKHFTFLFELSIQIFYYY